jgi:predicted DNA-binding WGR domain protein
MTDAQARTTYLELSDPEGGSHKFYEVAVEGAAVTTCFGIRSPESAHRSRKP